MFTEFWHRCRCPNCNKWNWVYDTHSDRAYSSNDMLVLKCWNCETCHWMHDEAQSEAKSMYGIGYTEETYIEDYGDLEGYDPDVKMEDIATIGKETP